MTRSQDLDRMTESDKQADLLRAIERHGAVRLESRQAVGFWGAAVDALVAAGKVDVEKIESYEGQYSCLQVTAKKGRKRR